MTGYTHKPDLTDIDIEVVSYIAYLEKIIEGYRENGAVQFMGALNRKLRTLAHQIDEANIDFSNSDDKTYDRFLATAKVGKDLASDFKAFLLEYGDKVESEDNKKRIPAIEKFVQNGKS